MIEDPSVFEKRFEELTLKLADPAVAGDREAYAALNKEYRELEPIAACCRERRQSQEALAQAQEVLEEAQEADLRALAQEEIKAHTARLAQLEEEWKLLLLPKDPNDEKNVIVEIRGGTGGEEAALFAYDLYRMYTAYAESRGWRTEIVGLNETELGGFKEVSFLIDGAGAYSRLKFESGVHRVQRVPETEAQGRIHTSAATVAIMPEAQEVEVDIDPKDLQIDTFRSSGAGGQHINKTSSAIRITHLPTGMVVECQDERSQYKNKDKAMKVLRARLLAQEREKASADEAQLRRGQVGSGDRSERIRTYNFPQSRVTDHRLGLTLYKLEEILAGSLDQLIDPLIAADRARRLQERSDLETPGGSL